MFLVLIKGMAGGEVSLRFPCVTPGVWELFLSFIAREVAEFSACWVFVDDEVNGVWVLFYWRPMPLWVMRVGFGNTCTVSVVELWVTSSGTPTQRVPNRWLCLWILNQGNRSLGYMNFRFSLYEICVQNHWGHKILRFSWELQHWRP